MTYFKKKNKRKKPKGKKIDKESQYSQFSFSKTPERVKSLLAKHGLKGVNKWKRTPGHPKKWGIVLAKEGNTYKLIRFGDINSTTAGNPSKTDTPAEKARRKRFKNRHQRNIKRGKLSAAHWSNVARW